MSEHLFWALLKSRFSIKSWSFNHWQQLILNRDLLQATTQHHTCSIYINPLAAAVYGSCTF